MADQTTVSGNPPSADEREALTKRIIPEMELSTPDNPLTAPRPPPDDMAPAERAQHRFAVRGNAIVTGGTGTLALHTARALLEHGLSGLALWDVNPLSPSAIAAINSLRTLFPSAQIFACAVDVRDPVSIQTALDKTIQEFGTVDILCCFAGVVSSIHALDISPEEWNKPIDVNLTGSFLASQALARQIVAQKSGGSIVLIASISGHTTNFPQPQVAYNASKAAVRSLTKSLAAEWSRYGIRVNCISPGYMDTILNEGEGLENCRRKWMERHPLGRMGDPWEVTGPVVMLVSNAGRYVNGADVVVDGGQLVF